MNRTIELLRLFVVCQRIDGRKKLQKIVHILKEAGYPFGYHYGFHFHGPFSAELKGEIDSLNEEELIDEAASTSIYSDICQYSYTPSPKTAALLETLPAAEVPTWKSLATLLNQKPAQELESISTVIYLMRHGNSGGYLEEQFKRLKPHLAAQFQAAHAFAQSVMAQTQ